jgi:hypothetical protein
MSKYILKADQEEFQVMDGPMEGCTFVHGVSYEEIPAACKKRFQKAPTPKQASTAKKTKSAGTGGNNK